MYRKRAIALAVIPLGSLSAIAAIWFSGQGDFNDPICDLARNDFQMQCSILSSRDVYDNLSIVKPPSAKESDNKIQFPVEQILSDSCLIKSDRSKTAESYWKPIRSVNFSNQKIDINRNLEIGAKVDLPEVDGIEIEAGPNFKKVRSVEISADSAQLLEISKNSLVDLLKQCRVRDSCLSLLNEPGVLLVNRLMMANNLKYIIQDTENQRFSLSAAINKDFINAKSGVSRGRDFKNELSSGANAVFAVSGLAYSELGWVNDCVNNFTILSVRGSSKSTSTVRGDKTETKLSDGDEEAGSVVRYNLSDKDRGLYESYNPSEAFSGAKWTYDSKTGITEIYTTSLGIAGMKWHFDNPSIKDLYSAAKAEASSSVSIEIGNRSDSVKSLRLNLEIETHANVDVPIYRQFEYLRLRRANGDVSNSFIFWHPADKVKYVDVGQVSPGEVVVVELARSLVVQSTADRNSGRINESLKIGFVMQ